MLRHKFGLEACTPDSGLTARKRAMRKDSPRIPKLKKKGKIVNHLLSQTLASKEGDVYFVSFKNKPLKHKVFEAKEVKWFNHVHSEHPLFQKLEKIEADIQAASKGVSTEEAKAAYQKVLEDKNKEYLKVSRLAKKIAPRTKVQARVKSIRLRVLDSKFDPQLNAWIARCENSNLIYRYVSGAI